MEILATAGGGALGGLIAYTVARLLMNGRYTTRDMCGLTSASIKEDIKEIRDAILRLECKFVELLKDRMQ